jgi:hypothetical protein
MDGEIEFPGSVPFHSYMLRYLNTTARVVVTTEDAATGVTERLSVRCANCQDELPAGACFCITCGEKVA